MKQHLTSTLLKDIKCGEIKSFWYRGIEWTLIKERTFKVCPAEESLIQKYGCLEVRYPASVSFMLVKLSYLLNPYTLQL